MSNKIKVLVPKEFEYKKVITTYGLGIAKDGLVILAHEDISDDPEVAAQEIFQFLTEGIPQVTYDLVLGKLRKFEIDRKRGGV